MPLNEEGPLLRRVSHVAGILDSSLRFGMTGEGFGMTQREVLLRMTVGNGHSVFSLSFCITPVIPSSPVIPSFPNVIPSEARNLRCSSDGWVVTATAHRG